MLNNTYLSVTQINSYIKAIFDAEVMLQNICVFGEVSSYNVSGGNAYFNLKDESGMIPCVLFGANKFDTPKIGDMVLVSGSMNYYAKGGRLSFNAYSIMPYGRGLLYEKFLKLKTELEERGYFDIERKKPIPDYVKRIGVVSSDTGAVIHDIINVTTRRNDCVDIVLYPVKVQGVGAEQEISAGIDFFSNYDKVDVIIVARGGGSLEDLEPFNSEVVANAVFRCKKPLVSAVGHETDFTIIDFVADLRAPTPSAAAELVVWDKALKVEKVYSEMHKIDNKFNLCVVNNTNKVLGLVEGYERDVLRLLDKFKAKIEVSTLKLQNIDNLINNKINAVDRLDFNIRKLNPQNIAKMGYSKILKGSSVVVSINDLNDDDVVGLSLIDGMIKAKVCKEKK